MMIGRTLIASTKPTITGWKPAPPAGMGVCTTVAAGQSPNTKRMPASANPTKASARLLRNVNRRTPARVRSANSAIANCSPSPSRGSAS